MMILRDISRSLNRVARTDHMATIRYAKGRGLHDVKIVPHGSI